MRTLAPVVAATLLVFTPAAHAATRYVSPTGTGTACTQTAPCGTLQAAYNTAATGDTIQVGQGSYVAQGTSSQPIMNGTKTVTVQGNGTVKIRQLQIGGSNLTFDGLDLDAAGTRTVGAVFETHGGANITFRNGSIGNVTDEKGALLGGNTDPSPLNVMVDNVRFHDIVPTGGDTHNEAVYLMAPGTTIRNSTFCTDGSDCGNTGAILTQRGSWWGQQPWNGARFLNNQFGRMMFDHGSILFGNHCGDIGATCRDIEIRGNSFDRRSMPGNATPSLTYTNSFESCNTADGQPVDLTSSPDLATFTHEPCGVDPTPTPTPTPSPTATPSATPTPTPTPSPPPGSVGRVPPGGTLTDWTGPDEMDGWDFTLTTPITVDHLCGQTNQASGGVTSVDLAIYSTTGTRPRLAAARYPGNPGPGQFCVTIPATTLSGTVRLAWLPHSNRLNFQGVPGKYVSLTGKTSPPATWGTGGGTGTVGAYIWAD